MRKGPVPKKALAIALPVALARGFVILCQRDRTSEIDLVIAGNGRTAFVCICRTKTLNALPAVLEAQFRILIAVLRRVPPCPGRSCEIWACDYNGNLRLFRLTATGMEEIGRDGNPLALPAPVPADGSAVSIPLHDRGGDPCVISRSGVPYHRALSRWRRNPRIGEAGYYYSGPSQGSDTLFFRFLQDSSAKMQDSSVFFRILSYGFHAGECGFSMGEYGTVLRRRSVLERGREKGYEMGK